MDLPIELFLSFIAFAVVMGIIGLWKRIPIMMFIAGAVITFWAITTDNIDMGAIPITNSTQLQNVLVSNTTNYHYIVETSNTDLPTHNGTGAQWGRSEGLKTTGTPSILQGDVLQCIDLYLAKVGSPPSPDVPEYILVGVWSTSGVDAIQSYGAMPATSLTTTLTFYSFCVDEGSERTLQMGDRVGFQYRAGNSSNYVLTRSNDVTGGVTFDGTNTVRVNSPRGMGFTTGIDTGDLVARMYDFELEYATIEDFDTTIEQQTFEFTEYPKILFGLIASIFMLSGALVWKYEEN